MDKIHDRNLWFVKFNLRRLLAPIRWIHRWVSFRNFVLCSTWNWCVRWRSRSFFYTQNSRQLNLSREFISLSFDYGSCFCVTFLLQHVYTKISDVFLTYCTRIKTTEPWIWRNSLDIRYDGKRWTENTFSWFFVCSYWFSCSIESSSFVIQSRAPADICVRAIVQKQCEERSIWATDNNVRS